MSRAALRGVGVVWPALTLALLGCARPARPDAGPAFIEVGDGFEAQGPAYRARVSRDGALSVGVGRRAPVELRTVKLGRGERDAPTAEARVDGDGAIALARGEVVERLRAGASGVEQSFEFAEPPRGTGDLIARIALRNGEPAGATSGGLRLVSGDRALVYDHAAWVDARGVRTELSPAFDGADIVVRVDAALVDRSAYPAVLDPTVGPEHDVAPHGMTPWHGYKPALACGDSGCLAAWKSSDTAFLGIRALHLQGDGTVIDPTFFVVDSDATTASPDVAWDGASFLVTYANDVGIWASRVEDQPHADPPVEIEPGAPAPSVARLAGGFVAVWGTNVFDGRLINADGSVSNHLIQLPPAIITGLSGTSTDVTFGFSLNGAMVQTFGQVGAPTGAAVQLGTVANIAGPWLAALGSTKLAVWIDRDANEVMGSIVPGAPFPILPVTTAVSAVAVPTADAANFWVTVVDAGAGGPVFQAVPIDAAGNVGSALPPVALPNYPSGYDAACDASGCVALLSDASFVLTKLRFGAQNDAAPTQLGLSDIPVGRPALGSDGQGYLALFDDGLQPSYAGERLDADGNSLGAMLTAVPNSSRPALTFDGTSYRVGWTDGATLDEIDRLPAMNMPGDVLKLDAQQTSFTIEHDAPDVACGPHECLLVDGIHEITGISFTDHFELEIDAIAHASDPRVAFGSNRYFTVWNAQSSIAGAVVDLAHQSATAARPIGTNQPTSEPPVIVFDGTNFVVAWVEPFAEDTRIRVARVGVDQKLVEPAPVTITTPGSFPSVALTSLNDGVTTVVAWQMPSSSGSSVYFERYANGALVGGKTAIKADGDACDTPVLASHAPGRAMIGYVRDDSRPQYGTSRVKVRSLDLGKPPGAACDQGDACSTSFCRDGRCCDTPCADDCQRCDASGKCVPVLSAEDPDTCTDGKSCDENGACVSDLGGVCNRDKDCPANGPHCVKSNHQSACCVDACKPCETCGTDGQCVAVVCSNGVVCSIEANACPDLCASSVDCKDGQICFPNGQCAAPPADPTSFADCALSRDADGPTPAGAATLLGAAIATLGLRRRRARQGRDA